MIEPGRVKPARFFLHWAERHKQNRWTLILGEMGHECNLALFTSVHARRATLANTFGSLPTAVWALNGIGTTINLGAGGVYTYLFASYNGLGAEVWYVGDLRGVITIPSIFNLCGVTKWTLFGPAGAGVPDSGVTAILLGVALGMLGICRRFTVGLIANPNRLENCRKY